MPHLQSAHTPLLLCDISREYFFQHKAKILQDFIPRQKKRQVFLGKDLSILFEHKAMVWLQIHGILDLEKDATSPEAELEAYHSLVPTKDRITITALWGYEDQQHREIQLKKLWDFTSYLYLDWGDKKVFAQPLPGEDAPNAEAKRAPSVSFLCFQAENWAQNPPLCITLDHPQYQASVSLSEALWTAFEGFCP